MTERRSNTFAWRLLRVSSLLVPAADRARWLEGWQSELWHLQRRARGRNTPSPLSLCLGAIPHGLWERKEWTMSVLLQDIRFAVRTLSRVPGFTVLAVVTMAIGIGVNTTIFSMADATLWQPPPGVHDASTLVQLGRDRVEQGFDNLSFPIYREMRDSADGLDGTAAFAGRSMALTRGDELEIINGQLVTGNFFSVLGTQMSAGRDFDGSDAVRAPERVAVISHHLWTLRFASAPDTIGSTIKLNGSDFQIIGITEPRFRGTDVLHAASDVFVPLGLAGALLGPGYADFDTPGFSWLWVVARRDANTTAAALSAELQALYGTWFQAAWGEAPDHRLGIDTTVGLRPEERTMVGQLMVLLQLVVAAVLLIACANLASMFLARGVSRAREIGIRAALGAGQTRIVRQVLTESLLIACAGGVLAVVLTTWTTRAIPMFLPIPIGLDFAPNVRVLGFGLLLSVVAGVAFGLLPALRAARGDVVDVMKDASPLVGRRAGMLRNGLVVGQLALSFVLLASTALLLRSTMNAQSADPGFYTANVMTMSLNLDRAGYDTNRGRLLLDELSDRARALPGVEAAGIGSRVPFGGWSRRSVFWPTPRPEAPNPWVEVDSAVVDAGYFETLGIALLEGEPFTPANSASEMQRVAVISRSAAELLWPGERAVGQMLPLDETSSPENSVRIIGIIADVQNRSLRQTPRPSMYRPRSQAYEGASSLFVRAQGDLATVAQSMRELARELDPTLGIFSMGSLQERMGRSLADTLFVGRLVGLSGALALALAAIGLYGVISFVASSRAHEVGVRMALGARRGDVLGLFAAQAGRLAALGIGLGVGLSLLTEGVIASLLFGVSGRDPLTLAAMGALLAAMGVLAAAAPVARAARLDPMRALRDD